MGHLPEVPSRASLRPLRARGAPTVAPPRGARRSPSVTAWIFSVTLLRPSCKHTSHKTKKCANLGKAFAIIMYFMFYKSRKREGKKRIIEWIVFINPYSSRYSSQRDPTRKPVTVIVTVYHLKGTNLEHGRDKRSHADSGRN